MNTEPPMNPLRRTLMRAGKRTESMSFPDGSRLLLLPEHGRLLGLYPADDDANFLWTNPALATAESAEAYFRRGGWPNPGGDRTWLAPEIELFIGDLARSAHTYAVPAALDPGNWTLASATHTELRLTQATCLRLHRAKQDVRVRLEKVLRPTGNPLPDAGLDYAGYSQATTLEVEPQPGVPTRLGIWNLLQLPQPGTIWIPTRAPARPHVVFGALAADELTETSSRVSWTMEPPGGDAKISLKPQVLTGRAGYLRETGMPGIQDLVVRDFSVGAERDYVDALWESPHEAGWAFQACCVRNGAECFNELEYHVPAATAVAGCRVSRDESRVWAFRGPKEAVAMAARQLLGNAVIG